MKLVVIQHVLQESAAHDFESLAEEVSVACGMGGETIVCPRVESVLDGVLIARPFLDRVGACTEGAALLVPFAASPTDGDDITLEMTPLGTTALLTGDEVLDVDLLDALFAMSPDALVVRPHPESQLQAEAFIEHALALSESVAPVVVLAEPIGGQGDAVSFGGSSVAVKGTLVAEAESESETEYLEVDIDVPASFSMRMSRPALPSLLEQRWAHHHGTRAPINYPADLS